MLDNNKNFNCDFSEQLVSYLYNELENAHKILFEEHLKSCSNCSEEFTNFALTRSSITEWRELEFSPLSLPSIEIPYEKATLSESKVDISTPWYVAIRNFFTLSPAWMTATTAVAALAICFGLFVVMFSDSRNNIAVVKQNNSNITPKPTTEITERTPEISPTIPAPNVSKTLPKPASKELNSKVSTETTPVKISTSSNSSKPVKPQNLTVVKTNSPKVETKSNKINDKKTIQKSPSLIDEEEEDDSLRLSDILEEVSMR